MPDKLNSTFFSPGIVPNDPNQLPQYLRDLTIQLQGAIQSLNKGGYDKTYVAPTKPRDGDVAYADGTYWNPGAGAGMYQYNGTAWMVIGDAKSLTGAIQMWPTGTAPSGYLLCNGASVSTTTYAALFGVIGYTFGGSGGIFLLPNYINRMPYGTTIGAIGGSADAIVPSHSHTATSSTSTSITDPGHKHSDRMSVGHDDNNGTNGQDASINLRQSSDAPVLSYYGTNETATTGISATSSTSTTVNATGVSVTNANLPPYLGINFIIKT